MTENRENNFTPSISSEVDAKLLLTARVCLLSIALFAATVSTFILDYGSVPQNYIFLPIAMLFAISAASGLWVRWKKTSGYFLHWQLLIDALSVTGAVYISGGASSPFLFLYLPLCMAAAIMVSRNSALFLTAFCTLSYSLLITAIDRKWISTADGGPIPAMPNGVLLHLVGLTSAMILVAVLTSYLTKIMRVSHAAVEKSRKDIEILNSSQRALEEQIAIQEKMARLLAEKNVSNVGGVAAFTDFIGESLVMQKIFSLIEKVAVSDATVLISGESGTGKELVARAIHASRHEKAAPFIAVNCGAIPENLIESQLFGHKRGSFTGAEADFPGLFLQADGGTIFLDEIGELPLMMQSKLLRAIQEKTVRPIGGNKDISIDVRIVAATNKNLKKEVEGGTFREDLYYRLNVISIKLPPLRARKDDIPLLTRAILRKLIADGKEATVPPGTMQLLMNYDYPGNVRELENILERAVVLGGEVILPEHLPNHVQQARSMQSLNQPHNFETTIIVDENISLPVNLEQILSTIERKYLEVALLKTDGAKKKAADLLGINFRSFRYRLQKFGIDNE